MIKKRKYYPTRAPLSLAAQAARHIEIPCMCCRQPFLSEDRRSNRLCTECKTADQDPASNAPLDLQALDGWIAGGVCGGGHHVPARGGCL